MVILAAFSLAGCVGDDDTSLPPYTPLLLSQDFETGADNDLLEIPGWINYAEEGTAKWRIQRYSNNGYAEFNPYGSGNVSNVGWLISPEFTLNEAGKTLVFEVSQSYVTSTANSFGVFISTDFSETNPSAATWAPLTASVPGPDAEFFLFQDSGEIDLSAYSGNVRIGFKVVGSGTNATLDGAYQIDNVKILK